MQSRPGIRSNAPASSGTERSTTRPIGIATRRVASGRGSWSRWSRTSPRRWVSKPFLWKRLGRRASSTCSLTRRTCSSGCKLPRNGHWIDFAGPAYNLYWYAVNHSGFKATSWEDYNKPEVKIAAMLGSADVVILQKVAPKATRVELNDVAATALAVTSGRADAMVTAVFGALVAKNRNPDLGEFVLPAPTVYLPSYVGLRREDNNTLQKFLQAWAEWNNLLGYTEVRIRKYLESAGATTIPDNVRF